eukprot:scaffold63191_cov39-Prasinocladus_malaysianus.AAC.1
MMRIMHHDAEWHGKTCAVSMFSHADLLEASNLNNEIRELTLHNRDLERVCEDAKQQAKNAFARAEHLQAQAANPELKAELSHLRDVVNEREVQCRSMQQEIDELQSASSEALRAREEVWPAYTHHNMLN